MTWGDGSGAVAAIPPPIRMQRTSERRPCYVPPPQKSTSPNAPRSSAPEAFRRSPGRVPCRSGRAAPYSSPRARPRTVTSDNRTTDARPAGRPTDGPGPSRALTYLETLLVVAVASALSWTLRDDLTATRLLPFWVSSAYAAWRGGLGPALLASALGVVVADYTTTPPIGAFTPPTIEEILSALVLLFVTGRLGATFDSLRRSRAEAVDAAVHLAVAGERLKEQAAELEQQLEESQSMAEELEQANEQLGVLSGYNERARTELEQAVERYRALGEAS